jgi:hypothetical protein
MDTSTHGTKTGVQSNAFGCITVPFLLIALIPLGWGARAQWANGELLRGGDIVPGRVIELRHVPGNPSMGDRHSSHQSAVVAFTTRRGEERVAVSSLNRGPAPWKVGDSVDVAYDPANPERADLRTEVAGWKLWLGIWCIVALLPAAIASLPFILLIRQRRAGPGV